MKTQTMRMSLITITVIALVGMAAAALAGPGYGRSHMGRSGAEGGPADCPRQGGYPGGGPGVSGLDEEQVKQFQEKRDAFFKETADLRQEMNQKRLEMHSEFARKTLDTGKLTSLQKEISALQATFAQKRLAHQVEMKAAFPDAGLGEGLGRGMGMARGRAMMGRGYGQGGCPRQ